MITVERMEELFDNIDEYVEFSHIENPAFNRPDLCAFAKLEELCPGSEDMIACAGHDEFYLDVEPEVLAEVATEEDILYLLRCGVQYDVEADSLYMNT